MHTCFYIFPHTTRYGKRSVRRNFADFQEIRQNDLIRFHELMVVQNEQMKIIKDKLLRMK
ncbi:hypothetical protein PFBG_05685 [Plasmodium falciparum 7G8]|uniref:Uncharacterized protein n=2 Tax=Plasmodium falciparum TaxID=5833 RepID=A0A024X085_PLAFC|nr:hypothetical protein PFMC_05695 [Plasmodium falciparum CAMP/Malaysia]EUR62475.1 hypothetical protein PFBG_05685 [Plasmodium falciparum 7G8]